MSKDYGYPSFELICRASSGDELAIREILKFYDGYISKLCLRPFYHSESGWSYVKIQYKLKWGFPHLNLPAAIRLAEAYDTALHNRLVTYNHSDYEFVSYCRMLPNIQKSNDMHDHNLES